MPGIKKKRPVHLDLLRIRLPVGGVVSIFHRVTGVFLALAMPWVMYLFQLSLESAEGFEHARVILHGSAARIATLILILFLVHHFLAGIRHLLFDLDIGIERDSSRRSAWAILIVMVSIGVVLGTSLML